MAIFASPLGEQTKLQRHRRAVISVAALCLAGAAFAQERGGKEQAKALADAAFEHIKAVGPEKAHKDFTTDKAA